MTFLSPLAALTTAALAVPLLLALYFLKLRRQPRVVPSTLLWRKAVEDLEVNAPFQRLRTSALLWLQLLLLLLLILAIARPASDAPAPAGARVAILIDRSASMAVEENGASRLEAARRAALGVIEAMQPGAAAMVVAFADVPEVVQPFSADRGRLRSAVAGIRGSDRPGRPGRALALVGAQAGVAGDGTQSSDAARTTVYLIGDSPLEADAPETALPAGSTLRYLAIGGVPPNLGFTAVGARRGLRDAGVVELFTRLENAGPAEVIANVALQVDGQRVATRRVAVPGRTPTPEGRPEERTPPEPSGGTPVSGPPGRRDLDFRFTAPVGEAVSVTLTHDRADALAADDVARLVLPSAVARPVVLVTEGGNPFLERALRAASSAGVSVRSPAEIAATPPPADAVLVFDRHDPAEPPAADALFFASVPPLPGLGLRPTSPNAPAVQSFLAVDAADPVMRSVDLSAVPLLRPGRLVLPPDASVLASGLEGPLMARVPGPTEGAGAGRRFLVVAPDPLQGRRPLSVSFAVFLVNALDELGANGGTAGEALARRTGEPVEVRVAPGADVREIRYRGPEDLRALVRGASAVLPAPNRAGWYEALDDDAVEPDARRLAVNLTDAAETDLRPPSSIVAGPGLAATARPGGAATVRRSWVPWLLAAAGVVLLLEWFVYTGRFAPTPPVVAAPLAPRAA